MCRLSGDTGYGTGAFISEVCVSAGYGTGAFRSEVSVSAGYGTGAFRSEVSSRVDVLLVKYTVESRGVNKLSSVMEDVEPDSAIPLKAVSRRPVIFHTCRWENQPWAQFWLHFKQLESYHTYSVLTQPKWGHRVEVVDRQVLPPQPPRRATGLFMSD